MSAANGSKNTDSKFPVINVICNLTSSPRDENNAYSTLYFQVDQAEIVENRLVEKSIRFYDPSNIVDREDFHFIDLDSTIEDHVFEIYDKNLFQKIPSFVLRTKKHVGSTMPGDAKSEFVGIYFKDRYAADPLAIRLAGSCAVMTMSREIGQKYWDEVLLGKGGAELPPP